MYHDMLALGAGAVDAWDGWSLATCMLQKKIGGVD